VEKDEFISTYTLFILTYVCLNRRQLLKRRYEEERERSERDPEYYPSLILPPNIRQTLRSKSLVEMFVSLGVLPPLPPNEATTHDLEKLAYDLSLWSQLGKLGCLDWETHQPRLRIGLDTKLPEMYENMAGRRFKYVVRDGKISPF
jgi:hypothetical protein